MALLISEHTPLFGFMEHGYRLEIVIAIVAEAVTIVALSAFLALNYTRPRRTRGTRQRPDGGFVASPPSPATEPQ